MKKVIAFTLYKAPDSWENENKTNFDKYFIGLNENIKIIKNLYPNWYVYLYHNKELNINNLNIDYDKFKTILIENNDISAMQWRFLPNDETDVDLFIVRDIDSRITKREVVSVNEWINSGEILHIMRDHPHHHYHILGGMWGMRRQSDFNMLNACIEYNKSNNYNSINNWYEKWWDMNFLRDVIYPKYNKSSYINSSYFTMEHWAKDFTEPRKNKHFIGEIFDQNNTRLEDFNYL